MNNILNVAYRNYKKMDAMRRIDWTSFSLVKSQSTIFAFARQDTLIQEFE